MSSTIERLAHARQPESSGIILRRRWFYRAVMGLLVLLLGLAVVDGVDAVDVFGPDEDVVTVAGAGYVLTVEHPSVSRPALASVFRITVGREGGFDEPVQLGVSRHYLEAWDLNAVLPAPSGETAVGEWILWEFDPPPGDELTISYEARLEPGLQAGRTGRAAVFVDDEAALVAEFRTTVRP